MEVNIPTPTKKLSFSCAGFDSAKKPIALEEEEEAQTSSPQQAEDTIPVAIEVQEKAVIPAVPVIDLALKANDDSNVKVYLRIKPSFDGTSCLSTLSETEVSANAPVGSQAHKNGDKDNTFNYSKIFYIIIRFIFYFFHH